MILFLRYWKYLAGAAVLALIFWQIHSYGTRRYDAGKSHVQAQWDQDKADRKIADDKIAADAKAAKDAAKDNNTEVMEDANAKLVAIAADRDSLAGRLRDSENRLRSLAATQGTDHVLADVAARVAARQAEIDTALADYDRACQRDAVRFEALQKEIRPQM